MGEIGTYSQENSCFFLFQNFSIGVSTEYKYWYDAQIYEFNVNCPVISYEISTIKIPKSETKLFFSFTSQNEAPI